MMAVLILLAQLASPLVEYQFLNTVEGRLCACARRRARPSWELLTACWGLVSVAVNLVATPFVHRVVGRSPAAWFNRC